MSSEYRKTGITFESNDDRIEVRIGNNGTIVFTDKIQDESVHIDAELWPEILASIEELSATP